jgi:hypothetical protein
MAGQRRREVSFAANLKSTENAAMLPLNYTYGSPSLV